MHPATSALTAYLAANKIAVIYDLFTFQLLSGTVLRYAAAPFPSLIIPSANFPSSPLNYAASGNRTFLRGPRFSRSTIDTAIGVAGNECDINLLVGPNDVAFSSLTWSYLASVGAFDGASIEVDRFFVPQGGDGVTGPLNTTLGAVVWFYGRVGETEIGSSKITIKAIDLMSFLEKSQMPRRVFQPPCTWLFGKTACGYNRTLGENALGASTGFGAVSVTALSGSTQSVVHATLGGSVTNAVYGLGALLGLTGANTGITGSCVSIGTNVINMLLPFPYAVTLGDTFQLLPFCDHTVATCDGTFNNLLRFGGFLYIPKPEQAL